ncbi:MULTISPECIES: diiron oxygenase [unclassified Streptomyces]|uniref:AurF N-oxygenase family protein n=1 Tax=Streptomycetaceae TaxID=2062 RepID=UPI002E77F039|nr:MULTISPECIES: diiron oxygenase [unclassified Streptomyces]MED7950259.1 diiron oxygenase [Streptomyces sp. BE303]MEE1825821.1 diiron oxygenase [Streptomyces sp. BE20]
MAHPAPRTHTTARGSAHTAADDDVSRRLLDSAATLSYDPAVEIDWDAPLPPGDYGLNPEWSTLYGTALWAEMTEEQRVVLTRHEVCSIMTTGIWFEMILQQMVLRDQYLKDPASAAFRFALTEIADECRHSIMFARACEKMGVPQYRPNRLIAQAGRAFKALARGELAYGGILVAEEVLDVMQRDWMRGENVLEIVRGTSRIHVVEESRHMKFARQEIRERLRGAGPARRRAAATGIATGAYVIVSSMVHPGVYAAAGLDVGRAVAEARASGHRRAMMRTSSRHLMAFLAETGLLTRASAALYRRVDML